MKKRKLRASLEDVGWDVTRAMSLGWELAAPIFVGVLGGHFLDQWLETGFTFTVGLLVWGVVGGFFNIWRFERKLHEHDLRRQARRRQEAAEDEKP